MNVDSGAVYRWGMVNRSGNGRVRVLWNSRVAEKLDRLARLRNNLMIDDLDKTIRAMLLRDLAITNLKVSFESPDAQFRPHVEPPALDLFLYDIRENRDLRSNEIVAERVQYLRQSALPTRSRASGLLLPGYRLGR